MKFSGLWLPALVLVPGLAQPPAQARKARLFLTIVMHNEEPNMRQPNYLNRDFYLRNREALRRLCLVIKGENAAFDLQSDWNFLQAVAKFDTGDVVANTRGKNIIKWMVDDLGFEADPHAHETRYNYADVAYLHTTVGVEPTGIVGGFLYSPDMADWEHLRQPLRGRVYPDSVWTPETLWGAATPLHRGQDDQSFGIWRPKDKNNFYVDDHGQKLNYIGGGCHSDVSSAAANIGGVLAFAEPALRGAVSPDGFYTARIMTSQGRLDSALVDNLAKALNTLERYVESGIIVWIPLAKTVQRWRTEYGSRASRVDCAALPK